MFGILLLVVDALFCALLYWLHAPAVPESLQPASSFLQLFLHGFCPELLACLPEGISGDLFSKMPGCATLDLSLALPFVGAWPLL